MELLELKKQLATVRSGKRSRYPAKLKQAVLAYAAKRRAQKASRETVASELEMSVGTLSYWCAPARGAGSLQPVTIMAAQPPSEVVIECGPLRVRGLGIDGVAELLRRLG